VTRRVEVQGQDEVGACQPCHVSKEGRAMTWLQKRKLAKKNERENEKNIPVV